MNMSRPNAAQNVRHFTDIETLPRDTLINIIRQGHLLKKQMRAPREELKGKTLALIFEKPSTRTRTSFDVAMNELGGHIVCLTGKEMQLGHGESIADTARVMSRFVHAMMIRTFAHSTMQEFAKFAGVPVINGLTDLTHPCQVMADLMTVEEKLRRITGITVAWLGDGDNNMLNSWMQAAALFNFEIKIACPDAYPPEAAQLESAQQKTKIVRVASPEDAIKDANVVLTDSWVSMHHTDADKRRLTLQPYQVNAPRMALAKKDAIFMHCLPAHRGEEVTNDVIDGPQSVVWDEAENRLHVQKAILLWCFGKI